MLWKLSPCFLILMMFDPGQHEMPLLQHIDGDCESQNSPPSTTQSSSIFSSIKMTAKHREVWGPFFTTKLKNTLYFLLPSWYPSSRHKLPGAGTTATATSYMSGVRGVASVLVFIHHYPLDYYPHLHRGYGAYPEDTSFFQLPFIRVIYAGRFMVSIFFVLSGYVLTYKPLQQIRSGSRAALADTLASSVFRRWFRLFLPIFLSTFIQMLTVHWGWYGSEYKAVHVEPIVAFPKQFSQWAQDLYNMFNPFTWVSYVPIYSPQLWTLPTEFRGSMLVFITTLGLSKAKTHVRMPVIFAFALYALSLGKSWDMFLFLSGPILAEAQLIQRESGWTFPGHFRGSRKAKFAELASRCFWLSVFIFSLFLAGWPDDNSERSVGYVTLTHITPKRFNNGTNRSRFWTSIGAVLMLASFENLPVLQRPFNTAVAEYLGEISFALYIVHVGILYTFGWHLTTYCIAATGSRACGFLIAACMVTPVTFWVADVFWRGVDVRCVKAARRLWGWASVPR